MNYFTTKEAAERLNYTSDACIRKLIQRGQLTPQRFGRSWALSEEELATIERIRKPRKKSS